MEEGRKEGRKEMFLFSFLPPFFFLIKRIYVIIKKKYNISSPILSLKKKKKIWRKEGRKEIFLFSFLPPFFFFN